jgi:hypothetical protein
MLILQRSSDNHYSRLDGGGWFEPLIAHPQLQAETVEIPTVSAFLFAHNLRSAHIVPTCVNCTPTEVCPYGAG